MQISLNLIRWKFLFEYFVILWIKCSKCWSDSQTFLVNGFLSSKNKIMLFFFSFPLSSPFLLFFPFFFPFSLPFPVFLSFIYLFIHLLTVNWISVRILQQEMQKCSTGPSKANTALLSRSFFSVFCYLIRSQWKSLWHSNILPLLDWIALF